MGIKKATLRTVAVVGGAAGAAYLWWRSRAGAEPVVYTCPECGTEFSSQEELDYHRETVHGVPIVYTCPVCGAEFSSQAELDYHMEMAHGPADIVLSDLVIEPAKLQLGDMVLVSALATNEGQMSGTKAVYLTVNGEAMPPAYVSLDPGETQTMQFSLAPEATGFYTVAVDGLSGGFEVWSPEAYRICPDLLSVERRAIQLPGDWEFYWDVTNNAAFTQVYELTAGSFGTGVFIIRPGETQEHPIPSWETEVRYYLSGLVSPIIAFSGSLAIEIASQGYLGATISVTNITDECQSFAVGGSAYFVAMGSEGPWSHSLGPGETYWDHQRNIVDGEIRINDALWGRIEWVFTATGGYYDWETYDPFVPGNVRDCWVTFGPYG